MTPSFSRFVAAGLFAAGGALVGIFAFAIFVARAVIAAGAPARPADIALLGDIMPLTPFIAGFAVASLIAAVAVLIRPDRDWLALAVAGMAMIVGVVAETLLILGNAPFDRLASNHALDGIEIIASFSVIYVVAAIALWVDRRRVRPTTRSLA